MRRALLLLAALLLAHSPSFAAELRTLDVVVTRIIDGDTFVAIDSNRLEHRVRLAGIDAPERSQPFSERSRQNLASLVHEHAVRIEWSKVDRYGRLVSRVVLPQGRCAEPSCPQVDVNLAQIEGGYAWHYIAFQREQSAHDRQDYAAAERAARDGGAGLWADREPVAPWDWRAQPGVSSVKKSRAGICHEAGKPSYSSVRHFEEFANLEGCIASGGRIPKSAR